VIILGVNAFHADSAACLVRDGKLVAAAEEERFRRVKHWAGFPARAIAYCLAEAGLRLGDVEHLAINEDSRAQRLDRLGYAVAHPPDPRLALDRWRNRRQRAEIPDLIEEVFPGERFGAAVHRVEHHLAHLASAFYVSPFHEAAVVSIDGFGDFASAAWGSGRGSQIAISGRVLFPHSLGVFYQALTQYLGFPHYGDEYKVMGLAPYGAPHRVPQMREVLRIATDGGFALDLDYFRHHRERIGYSWDGGSPRFADLFSPRLEALLGPRRHPDEPLEQRHRDIAAAAQATYEAAFFALLGKLQEQCRLPDIALAGGCAMNSVANGKIRRQTPFRRVYVQAAAGDAGGAIGAAFAVWHRLGGTRVFTMDHAYWGPRFCANDIDALLTERREDIAAANCCIDRITEEETLCRRIAAAVAQAKIVGWFQGRMEWGPRALGNRSIICDPRCADMKAILNAKIKRRESFRPFAPSVLAEAVSGWFEEADDVPFMMQVLQIREDKRAQIPAVTHVDGTGRLQTVRRTANPRYYRLIECFAAITGVPMVLNTSFNENEPVACTPAEALDCFLRTGMDMLALEDFVIAREPPAAKAT
jgi:carbamoyltransferase